MKAVKDNRAWIETLCWWGFGEWTLPTLARQVREATDLESHTILLYLATKLGVL